MKTFSLFLLSSTFLTARGEDIQNYVTDIEKNVIIKGRKEEGWVLFEMDLWELEGMVIGYTFQKPSSSRSCWWWWWWAGCGGVEVGGCI